MSAVDNFARFLALTAANKFTLPTGSGLIGFRGAGSGATTRTVEAKLRERISVRDYGAVGNGVTDDSAAVNAATTYASSIGGAVYFPASSGEYIINPTLNAVGYIGNFTFGPTLKYAIDIKSNVSWIGDNAVLKIAPNVSSRASPQNFAMFYTYQPVSNVTWSGLTLDFNSANNYFSPDPTNTLLPRECTAPGNGRYLRYHQAGIFVEGNTGKADNVLLQNMKFQNHNGVSLVICGRVGAAGVGRGWRFDGCDFYNVGLDTYDHSSIFLWADDAWVEDSYWYNVLGYAPTLQNLAGINSAIEMHGSSNFALGNDIDGANRGIFLTENGYSQVETMVAAFNTMRRIKYCGVDIAYDGSGGKGPARLVAATDNLIELTSDDLNVDPSTVPTGVQYFGLDSVIAPIESLIIRDNTIKRAFSPTGRASQGVGVSLQSGVFGKVHISGNISIGCTRGVSVITDTTTVVEDFYLSKNRWLDPLGGTVALHGVTKVGVRILAQGGRIERFFCDDEVMMSGKVITVAFTDAGDLVTAANHGWQDGQQVLFPTIVSTTGITVNTVYFIINSTTNTFKVSLTFGGAAIALTTNGTGTARLDGWANGLDVQLGAATVVGTFHVARSAVIDEKIPFTSRISGVLALTLTTAFGVPVVISYATGGALAVGSGAGFTGTLPGCGATGNKMEMVNVSGPVTIYPNNPTWFTPLVYASAANTARYWLNNTGPSPADPGNHTVALINYPR